MLYLSKGHYETLGELALPVLLNHVFSTASKREPHARRLTVVDLHRALEELLPRVGAQAVAQPAKAPPETGYAITTLRLRTGLSGRSQTVARCLEQTRSENLVWLHGANGVGKSTLAALMAQARGGAWIVADFRPFQSDRDSKGAIGVWHELVSAMTAGPAIDGVILDDISPRTVELIKSRIAGLVASSAVRNLSIIITSNHIASAARLAELGGTPASTIEAPYLSVEEVTELVSLPISPDATMVEGWAKLIHLSTSSGHPLLVTAKIANLRARGWPREALTEDLLGTSNEGIQDTRSEARRRLLAEVPDQSSVRAVLERASTVFQSFEDGLIHALCHDDPQVPHSSDALVLLKGSWIEPAPDGGWRLSPLIADLGADVTPARAQRWRQIAAVYWLSQRILDARTLPLCFWNAYLGKHLSVLLKVAEVIFRLQPAQLQSAATTLSPLTLLRTDQPILPEEPMTACTLRLLQVVVADAVEDEAVAIKAAQALLREIESAPDQNFRDLETSIAAKSIIWLDRVSIPPAIQLEYLLRLKASAARVLVHGPTDLKKSMMASMQALPQGADVAGALLVSLFMRTQNSTRLSQLIDALADLDDVDRVSLLQSTVAAVKELGTFIHGGWANEQINGNDLNPALSNYRRMRARVAAWKMPDLEAEFAIAESVILDEGLNDGEQALAVVDAALAQYGKTPALIRQKSKVLSHAGQDDAAASLLIEIEHTIGSLAPFDQVLALRDGAVAAARAKRYEDALRLFRKASCALPTSEARNAMRVGFVIDEALVLWEFGQRQHALERAADALHAVATLEATTSRQHLRTHRMARATVGLFMHDMERFPKDSRPAISPGMGSQIENGESFDALPLSPISDNWRVLEMVEVDAGVDAGIAQRANDVQQESRLLSIESALANARYTAALVRGDVDAAVRQALVVISIYRVQLSKREGEQTSQPLLRVDKRELAPATAAALQNAGLREALQGRLVDIMLASALSGSWTDVTRVQLETAVATHWGSKDLLRPLMDAASVTSRVDPSEPMAVLVAHGLSTLADEPGLMPRDRLLRDLYFVSQVGNHMSRRALEPLIVQRLASGWHHVLKSQSFSLSQPLRHGPAILKAIDALEQQGIRAAPALLRAAAPAVRIELSDTWEQYLMLLQGI
jgi:tetratricopeptide (TPR) repeat protein